MISIWWLIRQLAPVASTIHFDEISRKRIFAAVDNANFSDIKLIKENYTNLKNKLGRIPRLRDFDDYGEMDVLRIFDNNSLGSYYKFLVKYEKEYEVRLAPEEEKVIEFVSKKLASGKRIQELRLLNRMLAYAHRLMLFTGLQEELRVDYGIQMNEDQKDNIINIMTNEFPAGASKNTYAECVFIEKDEGTDYHVSKSFEKMLANKDFYEILKELIEFGISRYERDYSDTYKGTDFVLYQKYTYEDVCRLLNWETNEVPLNIGGYKYYKKTKTFPVFINYDKSEDISDTTKYEDHFTSSSSLIAISKSGRSVASEDVQNFLHATERGIQVHLFVRKNKDDKISKEFYYLGHMQASGKVREFVTSRSSQNHRKKNDVARTPLLLDGLTNKPTYGRHSNNAEHTQKKLVDKRHTPSHSVVLHKCDVEPIGNANRLTQCHGCLYLDLNDLIDDQNGQDDNPRHSAIGHPFVFLYFGHLVIS